MTTEDLQSLADIIGLSQSDMETANRRVALFFGANFQVAARNYNLPSDRTYAINHLNC